MNALAKVWTDYASEDRRMAELALQEGIWNQVCFHAQQCVEKLLKATLAEQGTTIPQVHRLVDLLGRVNPTTATALTPHASDIRSLDRFYIPTRYPDALPGALPTGLPGEQDATMALATATTIVAIIDQILNPPAP